MDRLMEEPEETERIEDDEDDGSFDTDWSYAHGQF